MIVQGITKHLRSVIEGLTVDTFGHMKVTKTEHTIPSLSFFYSYEHRTKHQKNVAKGGHFQKQFMSVAGESPS